jgi:hypothetical protein
MQNNPICCGNREILSAPQLPFCSIATVDLQLVNHNKLIPNAVSDQKSQIAGLWVA